MKLTGAEILIKTLIEQGVTDVFGYPGGQVVHIYDALYKYSNRINHILTAHEQGAAHAADGYARASGKVGVVIATSGPGATNLVTGIATAMLDSVPMVAITGNVPCDMIGRDSFQEIDITGITLPITKHNYFVNSVDELADSIREAFAIAKSGRPGPVLIDIPKDVQIALGEYEVSPVVSKIEQDKVSGEIIDEAVQMIDRSKRPYVFVGGGATVLEIGEAIVSFADKIDGFIGSTLMGLSAIPTQSPRFLGMNGMHGHYSSSYSMNQADLIIGIGVRFSDRSTGNRNKFLKSAKKIQLDADFAEVNKNINVDLGIVGDAADAFFRIAERVAVRKHPEWHEIIKANKQREAEIITSDVSKSVRLTPKTVFDIINSVKPAETVIATDVGQHQMWTAQYINLDCPRRLVTSGGLGTMGFGLGGAIGARIASGNTTVLITGDGSFGMNLTELATAVKYRLPIVIVIINNGTLGMVRQWQTVFFNSRYSSTTLDRATDFVKLAEAFGANGCRVETAFEFADAFSRALRSDLPTVIDVPVDQDLFVLPMLPPEASIDELITTIEK